MFENMLCVIPARGGSKGIPKKNMVKISGLPLIAYSIKSALGAGLPESNIVVSSDDDEILKYTKVWNVYAHKRPAEISTDTSSTEDAMLDVIYNVYPYRGFEGVILLQPTSPIRFNGRLAHAINTYSSGDYDSLLTATKFYPFFWQERNNDISNQKSWVPTYSPQSRPMRQQIPPEDLMYFDNGNIYITHIDVLMNTKCRIGSKPCIYQITDVEAMQIDTKFELQIIDRIIASSNAGIFRTDFLKI